MTQSKPPCTVKDCHRPSLTWKSGMCSRHYQRARSHGGDPLGGRSANGTALAYFREHLPTVTTECKIWPFLTVMNRYKSQRYGRVWVDGRYQTTHSLACIEFHGPRPPKLDACHLCGEGLCFNWAHLKWGTRKENMSHQLLHGTRNYGTRNWGEANGNARLSEGEAINIRLRYASGVTPESLAAEFDISPQHARAIGQGRKWKYLDGPTG